MRVPRIGQHRYGDERGGNRVDAQQHHLEEQVREEEDVGPDGRREDELDLVRDCLLYTSDAADE